jgi:hypothetical protein
MFFCNYFDPSTEVRKMLGQRLEASSLKSQTLPRMDGHDEEDDTNELPFDIMSIANSCPDLSIIESNEGQRTEAGRRGIGNGASRHIGSEADDAVDGFFHNNCLVPPKIPLSFRRR